VNAAGAPRSSRIRTVIVGATGRMGTPQEVADGYVDLLLGLAASSPS